VLVEDLQEGAGGQPRFSAEAPQGGNAGGVVAKEDPQESACDGQANPFGLGGAGELGLQLAGDGDGMTVKVAEPVPILPRLAELLTQGGDLLLLGALIKVAEDGVGFAIQPLSGDASLVGVTGDVAAGGE
jgi:hypothetical protein